MRAFASSLESDEIMFDINSKIIFNFFSLEFFDFYLIDYNIQQLQYKCQQWLIEYD